MDKNNPSEMSNKDLENEVEKEQIIIANKDLIVNDKQKNPTDGNEKHNGSAPDSETLSQWENENDSDKDTLPTNY